jgi:hypothetical protein
VKHSVADSLTNGRTFDRARHGMEFNISSLLQALALEVWLRSLEYKINSASSMKGKFGRKEEQANVFR